jgi:hypothetical protein
MDPQDRHFPFRVQHLFSAQRWKETTTMTTPPNDAICCLTLVKRGSRLARAWKLAKPAYGIYEYLPDFERRELRWGDGSWQELSKDDHADLILLEGFGDKEIEAIFD